MIYRGLLVEGFRVYCEVWNFGARSFGSRVSPTSPVIFLQTFVYRFLLKPNIMTI